VFVCLLATLRKKTTERILLKILPEMHLWTRKNMIIFWKSSVSGSEYRNVWSIFQQCEMGHFLQLGSDHLWKKMIGPSWKFYHRFIFGQKKYPLNFGKSSGSGSGLHGFVLTEFCILRVFQLLLAICFCRSYLRTLCSTITTPVNQSSPATKWKS